MSIITSTVAAGKPGAEESDADPTSPSTMAVIRVVRYIPRTGGRSNHQPLAREGSGKEHFERNPGTQSWNAITSGSSRKFFNIGLLAREEEWMPKYIIERDIPGAGSLSQQELQGISQTSCAVLQEMGPRIQWLESYVTGDKIYCVYIAPDEETVREHARRGGFPANRVSAINQVIDPTTAEA